MCRRDENDACPEDRRFVRGQRAPFRNTSRTTWADFRRRQHEDKDVLFSKGHIHVQEDGTMSKYYCICGATFGRYYKIEDHIVSKANDGNFGHIYVGRF